MLKDCVAEITEPSRLEMMRECENIFRENIQPKFREKIELAVNTRLLELEELNEFEAQSKEFIKAIANQESVSKKLAENPTDLASNQKPSTLKEGEESSPKSMLEKKKKEMMSELRQRSVELDLQNQSLISSRMNMNQALSEFK